MDTFIYVYVTIISQLHAQINNRLSMKCGTWFDCLSEPYRCQYTRLKVCNDVLYRVDRTTFEREDVDDLIVIS